MCRIIRSSFVAVLLTSACLFLAGCINSATDTNTDQSSETSTEKGEHCPLCDSPSRGDSLSSLGEADACTKPASQPQSASTKGEQPKNKDGVKASTEPKTK